VDCPTLVVTRKVVPPAEQEGLLAAPALAWMPSAPVARWRAAIATAHGAPRDAGWYAAVRQADALRSACVRALRDAGARLLLGTDTANPFVVPGVALHEELRLLVEAGLTPFEALRAGTADAAEFLGILQDCGTIATGKRADLLLIEVNPLESVSLVLRPLAVIAGGVWLEPNGLLAELSERIRAPSPATPPET